MMAIEPAPPPQAMTPSDANIQLYSCVSGYFGTLLKIVQSEMSQNKESQTVTEIVGLCVIN